MSSHLLHAANVDVLLHTVHQIPSELAFLLLLLF